MTPEANASAPDDSDADGMPDAWETSYGLDPYDPDDANFDLDIDGLSNLEEWQRQTNPSNPDSDGDGVGDLTDSDTLNPGALVPILNQMTY